MAVKDRKTKAAAPLTMEQVAERKMRECITAYRGLVARAAAGEQLPDDAMEQAAALLDGMGLPPLTWARDVQAQQQFNSALEIEARLTKAEPGNVARLQVIAARLKAIEAEVTELRAEQFDLGTLQTDKRIDALRRQNELTANHPHVFDDLEQAVVFRLKARHPRPATPQAEPLTGWSE
jgi:hypothetical protein